MRRINQILLAGVLISLGMLIQCVRGGFEARDGARAAETYAKLTVREGTLDVNGSATECGGWPGRALALLVLSQPGGTFGNQAPGTRSPREDGCIVITTNASFASGKYRLWVVE